MYTEIPSLIYQIGEKFKSCTVESVNKPVGKQALPHTSSGNRKWYRRTEHTSNKATYAFIL